MRHRRFGWLAVVAAVAIGVTLAFDAGPLLGVALLFAVAAAGVLAIFYLLVRLLGLPDLVLTGAIVLLLIGLPIILVTSLSTPADRVRGLAVGANAYVSKSSFDQQDLLELVQQLI